MGIVPKGGGGFLNGQDVTWVGYQWQAKTFDWGIPYNLECTFLVDGADEPIKTWLKLGDDSKGWGDGANISEDGLRILTDKSPHPMTEVGIFLASFIKAGYTGGFAEDENPDYLSLEHFVAGRPRFRVIQEVNAEKTAKFGQKKDRKDPTKAYDRRELKVEKFHGFTKTVTNGSGKAQDVKAVDLKPLAQETLIAVLKQAPGSKMDLSKIRQRATLKLAGKPNRDEVVKLVESIASLPSSKWNFDTQTNTVELIPF